MKIFTVSRLYFFNAMNVYELLTVFDRVARSPASDEEIQLHPAALLPVILLQYRQKVLFRPLRMWPADHIARSRDVLHGPSPRSR